MGKMAEEDEREQNELRAQISRLEGKVQEYERTITEYVEQMKTMQQDLGIERSARVGAQRELAELRGHGLQADVVPLPSRKKAFDAGVHMQHINVDNISADDLPTGCGNCTINSRCECFERAVNVANYPSEDLESSTKRPHSPLGQIYSKRMRQDSGLDVKPEDMETDFTTRHLPLPSISTVPPRVAKTSSATFESCGFCSNGTACLCRELAEDANQQANHSRSDLSRLLSNPLDLAKYMSSDSPPTYPQPSAKQANTCENGPGTCSQCQRSPTSTLFCKSLAATRCDASKSSVKPSISSAAAPCGNPNGCCRTQLSPSATVPYDVPSVPGPTLSCADAFTTLSRHPAFDRASDELGVWLPKLQTVPKGLEGRTAFEIEAASVMGVLRFFDRRFGREG